MSMLNTKKNIIFNIVRIVKTILENFSVPVNMD